MSETFYVVKCTCNTLDFMPMFLDIDTQVLCKQLDSIYFLNTNESISMKCRESFNTVWIFFFNALKHLTQYITAKPLHVALFPEAIFCQTQHGLDGGKNNQGESSVHLDVYPCVHAWH